VKNLVSYLYFSKRFSLKDYNHFMTVEWLLKSYPRRRHYLRLLFIRCFSSSSQRWRGFPLVHAVVGGAGNCHIQKTPFSIWASWGNRSFYLLYNDLIEKRGRAHYLPRLGLLLSKTTLGSSPPFFPRCLQLSSAVYINLQRDRLLASQCLNQRLAGFPFFYVFLLLLLVCMMI